MSNVTRRLEEARAARRDAEAELRAQREIKCEETATMEARVELAKLNQSAAEKSAIVDRWERIFDSK